MAETADETSTLWPLWRTELAFVAEHTKSETTAKDLLVDHLEAYRIRWRYWQISIDDPAPPKPGLCPLSAVPRFIWRAYRDDKYATIDDANSTVTYIGPPWYLRGVNWDKIIAQPMTDASFCDWEKVTLGFLPQLPPVTVQLKLLYLHHGDVLTMLRGVGLLTPARTPSSPSASAISTAAEEKQTGDAATATAGSAASGSEETPPKETAASWTAKAAKRRSQRKGEEVTDWADRLLLYERPPKTWSRRTIANELYKLLRP